MSAHILIEIFLLLLVCFVIGCIIGCIARRMFGTAPATEQVAPQPAVSREAPAAPAPKQASQARTAKSAPAKKAPSRKAPAKTKAAKAEPAEAKPRGLKKARASGADDLKKISGIGPVLEKKLNDLGYFHFDQIAKWTRQNVAWVDDHLNFKGRIDRDDWIGQAKRLAKGGK